MRACLQLIRIGQWPKNMLVMTALATSLSFTDMRMLGLAVLAAAIFCLLASTGYIINDLMDLEYDRHHPRKKMRPLVTGACTRSRALWVAGVLGVVACGLSYWIHPGCLVVALLYLATVGGYSWKCKRLPFWDVLVLTAFYLMRIWFGGIAIGTGVSFWLEAFALFVFLSLALQKRYVDIQYHLEESTGSVSGRGYTAKDERWIVPLGMATVLSAVVVFFLYLDSANAALLYRQPERLLWLGPVLLVFLLRVWVNSIRGILCEEAFGYVIRSPSSYVLGLCGLLILLWAI